MSSLKEILFQGWSSTWHILISKESPKAKFGYFMFHIVGILNNIQAKYFYKQWRKERRSTIQGGVFVIEWNEYWFYLINKWLTYYEDN